MYTIDFDATTGAGNVEVKVTMSFEADKYSTWAENIEMVTYSGMDVMGMMTDEQFAELEAEGLKAIDAKRQWEKDNYEP
jgi:hypothetical protein